MNEIIRICFFNKSHFLNYVKLKESNYNSLIILGCSNSKRTFFFSDTRCCHKLNILSRTCMSWVFFSEFEFLVADFLASFKVYC